jgi:hypothetical protein
VLNIDTQIANATKRTTDRGVIPQMAFPGHGARSGFDTLTSDLKIASKTDISLLKVGEPLIIGSIAYRPAPLLKIPSTINAENEIIENDAMKRIPCIKFCE